MFGMLEILVHSSSFAVNLETILGTVLSQKDKM